MAVDPGPGHSYGTRIVVSVVSLVMSLTTLAQCVCVCECKSVMGIVRVADQ